MNHKFDITTSATIAGATWVPLSGINSWEWNVDSNDQDVSDFDN